MGESVVINSQYRALPVQTIHHLLGMLPTWFLTVASNSQTKDTREGSVVTVPTNAGGPQRNSRRVKTRFYSYEVYWAAAPDSDRPQKSSNIDLGDNHSSASDASAGQAKVLTRENRTQVEQALKEQAPQTSTQWIVRQSGG